MLYFLIAFCCCQQVFAQDVQRHIAVLIKPDFRGEISFAYRIQSACKNLHWEADVLDIHHCNHLSDSPYDFVINLVPGSYPHPKCKNYMAIFHPTHHYFDKKGFLKKKYRRYDGYLLTYSPQKEPQSFFYRRPFPYIQWYPTVQRREHQKVDPSRLFHICCLWGNRFEDKKFRRCLHLLDKEPSTRFYGSQLIQSLYPKSYQKSLPYEGEELYETAAEAGVTLVLHSSAHNRCGVPSGRIFEAAAASTVIICDENTFVREHFGDSVLYINTDETGESIYKQIRDHMHWIQSHKEAALEKAAKAHAIYKEKFALEDQLLRLGEFHDQQIRPPKSLFQTFLSSLKNGKIRFSWIRSLFSPLPFSIHPSPVAVLSNPNSHYSLINSVDFHPKNNLFCATYTHNNKIIFYEIDANQKPQIFQILQNPRARLSEPQHAVFSPDGKTIAVANWTNQTLALYRRKKNGFFRERPIAVIPSPERLKNHKPHGIAFSPCGTWLAIAYGAARYCGRAIALFQRKKESFELISLLNDPSTLPGIPKGIAFSPDGSSLLVTFCEAHSLAIFGIDKQNHSLHSKQIIQSPQAQISRPEDIKISPDGRYCAVSNSDQHTVAIFPFDPKSNSISQATPFYVLQNPEARLYFPHGIAFSRDGSWLAITQFGPVDTTEEGDIAWSSQMDPSAAKINLYSFLQKP